MLVTFSIILLEEVWTWSMPLIEMNTEIIKDFYWQDTNYGHLFSANSLPTALAPPPAAAMQTRKGGMQNESKPSSTTHPSSTNGWCLSSSPSQHALLSVYLTKHIGCHTNYLNKSMTLSFYLTFKLKRGHRKCSPIGALQPVKQKSICTLPVVLYNY